MGLGILWGHVLKNNHFTEISHSQIKYNWIRKKGEYFYSTGNKNTRYLFRVHFILMRFIPFSDWTLANTSMKDQMNKNHLTDYLTE